MDTVSIIGLKVMTTIGCWDWEQAILQPLFIDIICEMDMSIPGKSDLLVDALDYDRLTTDLQEKMQKEKNKLIETVAEKIAGWVLDDPRVRATTIKVHKPYAIQSAEDIVVAITRGRDPHRL